MNEVLEICHKYLLEQYSKVLGQTMGTATDACESRWFLVGSGNFEEVPSEEGKQSAVVVDNEIGLLLFLVPFDSNLVDSQINQALRVRSLLLPDRNFTGSTTPGQGDDPLGAWRVSICWLVPEARRSEWIGQVVTRRRNSSASEEIPIDAVFYEANSLDTALQEHGLPRLLIQVRALFARRAPQVDEWASLDSQIRKKLEILKDQLEGRRERELAQELLQLAGVDTVVRNETDGDAMQLSSIDIENFRSIRRLSIHHSEVPVAQAIVIHGPNGTGKSSLAEALALGIFKVSSGFRDYMRNSDIQGRDGRKYVSEYLRPIDDNEANPRISVNNGKWHSFEDIAIAPDGETLDSRVSDMDGVLSSQEESIDFMRTPAGSLAERLLRGSSRLASTINGYLEKGFGEAQQKRTALNHRFGMLASTKRLEETIYPRIVSHWLRQLPAIQSALFAWLSAVSKTQSQAAGSAGEIVTQYVEYSSEVHRSAIAKRIAAAIVQADGGAISSEIVLGEINRFNSLATLTRDFLSGLEKSLSEHRGEIDRIVAGARLWGEWLGRAKGDAAKLESASTQVRELRERRSLLGRTIGDVLNRGKLNRERIEHLDKTEIFLRTQWAARYPSTCPTCDSDLASLGGVLAVFEKLKEVTQKERQDLLAEHGRLSRDAEVVEASLRALGAEQPPVGPEDQAKFRTVFAGWLPRDADIESLLASQQTREKLLADILSLKTIPSAVEKIADTIGEAKRIALQIEQDCAQARNVSQEPEAWASVKQGVESALSDILVNHLPETIGRVWKEIALNLTSASWLLPDIPRLTPDMVRGQQRVFVHIGEHPPRAARHILNLAEQHVLGLAWFFTRHLSYARFRHSWMVLDDPAVEMDQTTFRDLCRFWGTLLRLYRGAKRKFTLVVLLHQEERSLDAARETDGRLHLLGWTKVQDETIDEPTLRRTVLLGPGFHPRKPEMVLKVLEVTAPS